MAPSRACQPLAQVATLLRQGQRPLFSPSQISNTAAAFPRATATTAAVSRHTFHTTAPSRRMKGDAPQTDFGALNVLADAPVPATSVDVCAPDGFHLNSGAKVVGGSGVLLVGGEAFTWQPWLARGGGSGEKRLVNRKGQWEVPNETFGLFGLVWPRPDLLILGLGPLNRPISPELKRHIGSLGMRVEVLDTRNAAAQYNLLATERGLDDVAAALIPVGWREGVGAA
ncbi:uncharacterized protein F4807DRAFT_411496 [Annulohypoxylon truncatum]|uniref:uncharacterized protein n=1 Tax=Annulohypoxylon truncatum TaxID=327061 RepID=UPI002007DE98|nr:uncharacterized protein F4807DRAFT_411496 [Annulohypoxylon truncatum]KAI1213526.1 hypothetical protein F4807DRAFT_411496 [Annulohypoxylon truncatum]